MQLCYRAGSELLPLQTVSLFGASFNVAYTTAYHCLMKGQLTDSDSVLINGATGGVGSAAIEIARASGKTIIATGSGKQRWRL